MDLKNILNEGSSHQARLSETTRVLASKWEKTGLLEGIDSEVERAGVATLLENQAKQLVKEASSTGTSFFNNSVVFFLFHLLLLRGAVGFRSPPYMQGLY